MKREKALVLYSGGLDSRLVVAILKKQGYKVEAIHFNLPFGCGCCNLSCNFNFLQIQKVKMVIKDVTKGKLLKEYLKILKNPKHGTGVGVNPCKDCKIWMFRQAKKYADKNKFDFLATGEVLGQRPMSQTKKAMEIIDKELGFKIKRPLTELGIRGRRRESQIKLAKEFGIKYPSPGGGCLLCEKELVKRFKVLLSGDFIDEKTLQLICVGKHFFIDGNWFVVARDEKECYIIEKFSNSLKGRKRVPAVYFYKKSFKKKAEELQKAYEDRKSEKFIRWKL